MTPTERILIFGATGAIGQSIVEAAVARQWHVTAVSRTSPANTSADITSLSLDPLADSFSPDQLNTGAPYTSVCWAQGANTNDSIYNVDPAAHLEIYRANCLYIIVTLQALLQQKLLAPASRLCVISSVWQNFARQSKLSYCMSKAALQGLVLSATVDLGAEGHLINAVLPGALDTPMARKNLTPAQLERMTSSTSFGRLPALTDVASLVCYLCSPENTGVTGQFISADLGYSHVRIV